MEENYILTRSLNCAAYIIYRTGFRCMPEVVESEQDKGLNVFRFNRCQEALDAYNLYKSKKSSKQSLHIKNLFYYNFAIKKCKKLLREYKKQMEGI